MDLLTIAKEAPTQAPPASAGALRIAATVAWLAPLAVYLYAGSRWASLLAAVVAVKAALLCRFFMPTQEEGELWRRKHLFQPLPSPPLTRLLPFVSAAFALQATAATGAMRVAVLSAAFAFVAASIIAWQFAKQRQPATVTSAMSRREFVSSILTLIVALTLTATGIGFGSGDGDDDGVAMASGAGGAYWGVFLWPHPPDKPKQLLITPLVAEDKYDRGLRLKLKIPFDGVYWFFRAPAFQPPRTSTVMYGRPDDLRFLSTDNTPLYMEAHQTLASHIDLACCTSVDVGVVNADTNPGTVALELLLMDSEAGLNGISLGELMAPSRPGKGVLSFPIPSDPRISSFDRIVIRFLMQPTRDTASPKIAIEDLVMIPR